MTKIRCGGYVFYAWVGDHEPRHVHVHREDGRFVVKWDLEAGEPLKGMAPARLREVITMLKREGRL